MNFESARMAMVESQLMPNGVRDPRILQAFATMPRENFVPNSRKALAYMDETALAVAARQQSPARYLLSPMVLGRMLQFAHPAAGDRALDIGGATGYSAAILSRLCVKVDALEVSEQAAGTIRHCLGTVGADQVKVHHGALDAGLPAEPPFNLILVSGAVSSEPKQLLKQLAEGGRLVAIIRKGWLGHAYLYTKALGVISGRPVFDASAEFLPGFEAKPEFVF